MSQKNVVRNAEVILKHRRHEKDTGSPEVQIALLTSRIEGLSGHFKKHVQDKHSERGLLAMVAQRKSLLNYLKNEDIHRYRATLTDLNLRK